MTVEHELDASPWLRVEATIMASARQIRAVYDERFADLDLNLTQASLLAYVSEFGTHTQAALAERLDLGRAAAGTVIDQLEGRDLVERNADPDDRRVWMVSLTTAGKDLVDRINAIDVVVRAELRSGISREERTQLASLLVRLQENVASASKKQ